MIKSVIFAATTNLIGIRNLDLNSRILNAGREREKKRHTRKSRAQMIKVVGKKGTRSAL